MAIVKDIGYCAFCKSKRTFNRKKHMSWLDGLKAGVVAWSASFIFWQEMDFKFLVVWGFVTGVWEVVVQIRWRMDLVCTICQFDPLLYLKNPDQASLKVKGKLEERRLDPLSLMRAPLPVLVDRSVRAGRNAPEKRRQLRHSVVSQSAGPQAAVRRSNAPRSVKSNRDVVPASPLR